MAKREPTLIDPRLAKAHEHPIRIEILRVLHEGPNSPGRISRRLEGVSLNLVSHHMKVLQEAGCIEMVETLEKSGATEHIYRALEPRFFETDQWVELPPERQQPMTATILRLISADVARALMQGTYDELLDRHLSRSTLSLDKEGWQEIVDTLRRTLEEILATDTKSSERLAASGEEPIAARVAIMQFVVPRDEES